MLAIECGCIMCKDAVAVLVYAACCRHTAVKEDTLAGARLQSCHDLRHACIGPAARQTQIKPEDANMRVPSWGLHNYYLALLQQEAAAHTSLTCQSSRRLLSCPARPFRHRHRPCRCGAGHQGPWCHIQPRPPPWHRIAISPLRSAEPPSSVKAQGSDPPSQWRAPRLVAARLPAAHRVVVQEVSSRV
jgi:hypothetical protein